MIELLRNADETDLTNAIELKLALVLFKLENAFLMPSVAVNVLLKELQYLLGAVSV